MGAEGKLSYRSNRYKIVSTLGVIEAKADNFNILDTPQLTASLGGEYKLDNNYYIQANATHTGKRYYNMDNTKSLDSYTVANISTGYKNNSMDLSFYITNLFDKEYSDFMIATPSNSYYHFGKPRVAGVRLSYRY